VETLSLLLDFVLIIAAVAAYIARPRIGGELAKGLQILMIGIILFGLAHLSETILYFMLNFEFEIHEIVERIFEVIGFAFVIWGFLRMRKAFKE
jgi:hypothetical protein